MKLCGWSKVSKGEKWEIKLEIMGKLPPQNEIPYEISLAFVGTGLSSFWRTIHKVLSRGVIWSNLHFKGSLLHLWRETVMRQRWKEKRAVRSLLENLGESLMKEYKRRWWKVVDISYGDNLSVGPISVSQCESHVKSEIETSAMALRMLVPGAGTQECCAKS